MPNECEASQNFCYLRFTMKRLPIGIQDFETLINNNYYYVDKTPFIYELVQKGKFFFLARPRRFGKSLFVSTIKAAFEGKKQLFKGLFLENHWNWKDNYPVVLLSFGRQVIKNPQDFIQNALFTLQRNAKKYKLEIQNAALNLYLSELIEEIYHKFQKPVVLLIDEYDKPLLDVLPNSALAYEIRDQLRNLYAPIKDLDPYLKFVFITGVSQFTKVSLFSELNNLRDITLSPTFGNICGYTQEELENTFKELITEVDLEQVRSWYNGYYYLADKLYNPFDILLFLEEREFRSFWFDTGTPSFLIHLLQQERFFFPQLEDCWSDYLALTKMDVEHLEAIPLMFQTGYLTIKERIYLDEEPRYRLGYPNKEVERSFNRFLLPYWLEHSFQRDRQLDLFRLAFAKKDFEKVCEVFNQLLSGIPYDWFRKNRLAQYEGYWASVFYMALKGTGLSSWGEDTTNTGRIDMVVELKDAYVLLEFKVGKEGDEVRAIEQIKTRGYVEKYTNKGKEVVLLGLVFDRESRRLVGCKWEIVE